MKIYETPAWCVRIARYQAERVAHTARWVLLIDSEGDVVSVKQNNPHYLDVIAVIGPADVDGVHFEITVLLEIGRGKGRPYSHGALRDKKDGRRKQVSARRKFATIDQWRFAKIWKRLEAVMVEDASRMSRHGVFFQHREREIICGVTYSISERDPLMLAAVLQSERKMRTNPLDADMEKAAQLLEKKLYMYDAFSYAPKREIEKEMGKKRSGLEYAIWFLTNRRFLPHQLYLIEKRLRVTRAWDMYERLMRDFLSGHYMAYQNDDTRVVSWGALLERSDIPTFDRVYVWSKSETFRRRANRLRKTGNAVRRRFFKDVLIFFFTPLEIVEEARKDRGDRGGELILPDGARRIIQFDDWDISF